MKKLLNIITLLILCSTNYAQDNYGTLTVSELNEGKNESTELNYLIRNHLGELIDVRDGKVVSTEPYHGYLKKLSDGSIAYKGQRYSNTYLQFYTPDLKKGKKITVKGHLAPSWEYTILVKMEIYTGAILISPPKHLKRRNKSRI